MGLCGQLAAQFPDIFIFSGNVKERMTAAKETLLQSALCRSDTPPWACVPGPGKLGIPGHTFVMGDELTGSTQSSVFSEKISL